MKGGIGWHQIDLLLTQQVEVKLVALSAYTYFFFFREHFWSLNKRLYYLLCDGELVSSNSWLHHIPWFLGFWFLNIVSWSFQSGFSESLDKHLCKLQGYPNVWDFRRLYRIFTVCFLIFLVPCNCKLDSYSAKSLIKPLKDST